MHATRPRGILPPVVLQPEEALLSRTTPPPGTGAGVAAELVDASIRLYFGQECRFGDVREIVPPAVDHRFLQLRRVVANTQMTFDERAIIALALVPHVRPQLLDPFLVKNPNIRTRLHAVRRRAHGDPRRLLADRRDRGVHPGR